MKNNLFRFTIIINMVFFLFGFILLGSAIIGIENVTIQNTDIELKFDFANIILSIIGVIIFISLLGLNILGSGLQDSSVRIVYKVLIYLLLWVGISIFSIEIFTLLPVVGGTILYPIFTIIYAISFLIGGVESEL